jgi:hypothetical protein
MLISAPVRTSAGLSAFLVLALVACDSKKESPPAPSAEAKREPLAQPSSPAPSVVASIAPTPTASVATSASAAPSAKAAGPCPPNAKNYDEPKFCVTFLEEPLDITYEGGPDEGNVELEAKGGGVIRLTWVPLARAGKESLRAEMDHVDDGWELVASGDLPGGGAWSDMKKASGDEKVRHVVRSAVKTKRVLVNCYYATTAENADKAREVCKSVRGY